MKAQHLILILLTAISCTTNQETNELAQEEPTFVDQEADKSAIQEAIKNYGSALEEGSADNLVKVFTDDAVLLPNNNNAAVGKSSLLEWFQTTNVSEITLEAQEIKIIGDYAMSWTENSGTLKDPETKEDVEINSKSLILLKKDTDGAWKFYRYMFNGNSVVQ